ncbi:MAG: phage virion morphogenesis protein [Magnetococcales bacterium]|nr:phage virion morphogenesis protein [Magnetococcales bacterium]
MAGVLLEIKNSDAKELEQSFARLAKTVRHLEPVLKDIGHYLLRSIDQRFDDEVKPQGGKWDDISKYTKEKKRGRFGEGRILTDRGRLRRSITFVTDGNGLLVGTNVIYAAIHQLGGETGRKGGRFTLPARPFLGISGKDKEGILQIIADCMCRAARGRS